MISACSFSRVISSYGGLAKGYAYSRLLLQFRGLSISTSHLLHPSSCQIETTRNAVGSFNRLTGQQLWGSVSGVSGAGKKQGRGKRVGRKKSIDLNRGQVLGTGEANIVWPGLNAPVIQGSQVIKQQQLPPNPSYKEEIIKRREQSNKFSHKAPPPLLRGYTGRGLAGMSIGPPDPIGDYKFTDFDSRVLEYKIVQTMTGTLGRKRTVSAFVAVGNGNGLAGFAKGKAQNGKTALQKAKNRAAQRLMYVPRYENHTVYHNMYTQFHKTRVFIHRKEKGYGVVAHRVINTLCQLVGITDLHCKVQGSTANKQTLTKAFFQAVTQQETFQEISDRTKLHVVSFRPERDNMPVVVASPSDGHVSPTPYSLPNEDLEGDFDRMHFGGRVEHIKQKKPPFHPLKSYKIYLEKQHRDRNQRQAWYYRRAGLW